MLKKKTSKLYGHSTLLDLDKRKEFQKIKELEDNIIIDDVL